MRFIAGIGGAALLGLATLAQAQVDLPELDRSQPVALTADTVTYDTATGRVTATGAVEVYYGDRTLTADSITYDDTTRRITATGRIVVRDPSGATVFADIADLDVELRDGLVRGAKSVLGQTVRLSAVEARRVDGRFNTLNRAVYSACEVCADDPTPLWQIRAGRVIHDEQERVIHYEDATFDVFGIPILWSPYFSHPDPTVERASGVLAPSFEQSTNFGYGFKLPYYLVLDEQSDLTLTPYVTTGEGLVAIGEYRRVFDNGAFRVLGSVTHNDFSGSAGLQGHIDTDGQFDITDDTYWGWDITATSDDAYLRFFELSNADRLTSEAYVRNYGPRGYFDATAVYFQSLRDNDPAGQIPLVVPDFSARREYPGAFAGGDFGVFFDNQALLRNNGLDSSRLSIGMDWERQVVTPQGIALRGFGQIRGDLFLLADDPVREDETRARFAPLAGVEARYPLIWDQGGGVSHVLEPMVQAIAAPYGGNDRDITNEDSLVTEFDETNLFDLNHFSGLDGFEEGPRFNLGLRYERVVDDGIRIDATLGRVLRFGDANEFSAGSGLSTAQSDWVGAWGLRYDPYVTLRQRVRVGDDSTITRNEVFADTSIGPVDLTAAYVFLESDPEIGALLDREEVTAGGAFRLTPNWTISAYTQRDLAEREFVEIAGGVTYTNECCAIDLFVRRRFTDQDNAPASTSVGVQVKLLTLGGDDTDGRDDPVSLRRARWQKMIGWLLAAMVLAGSAVAQTPFRPVAVVNAAAITGFDLAQRAQIMVAMGFPAASADALRSQALDQLVEDRLKLQEGARLGLTPSPDLINAGLEEFAGRAKISIAEFKTLMNTQGVTDQALNDLVGAEVVWREVIRGRFARRVDPGEAEIDAEIALAGGRDTSAFRVLEIGLPLTDGGRTEAETRALADQLYTRLTEGADFLGAVRTYSRAPSAARGGEVGWVSSERMPGPLVQELAGLQPGQVTRPLPVAGGLSILKLVERRSGGAAPDPTNPALRAEVRERLVTQQSLRLAEGLLQELRRDALIEVR